MMLLVSGALQAQTIGVLCAGELVLVEASGLRVRASVGPLGSPRSLAASPDGKLLAVGSDDDTIHLYSLPEGKTRGAIQNPYLKGAVGLAFSADGHSLLVLSEGVKALVEVGLDGQIHRVLGLNGPAPVTWSVQGSTLLVVQQAGWVSQVSLDGWETVRQDTLALPVGGAALAGEVLVVSHPDQSQLRLLAGEDRQELANHGVGPGARAVQASPHGDLVVVISELADSITAVDPSTGKLVWKSDTGKRPRDLLFSRDGKWLYVANQESSDLSVFEAVSGRELGKLPLPPGPQALIWIPSR